MITISGAGAAPVSAAANSAAASPASAQKKCAASGGIRPASAFRRAFCSAHATASGTISTPVTCAGRALRPGDSMDSPMVPAPQ